MPKRIQRRRVKGWRMPAGAVYVGRPSKWGNPWGTLKQVLHADFAPDMDSARKVASAFFRDWLTTGFGTWANCDDDRLNSEARQAFRDSIPALKGKDLACWCPVGQPCHADLLLTLANDDTST